MPLTGSYLYKRKARFFGDSNRLFGNDNVLFVQ